jgi:ubiquitin-protein ligase E3 C
LTAVVLSTVVLEQCRFLLVDSYVRDLFNTAINDISMGTENTLSEKTEKDLKQEKELSGNTTAASLAAKEARIDRTKGFWNSSKWAKNVKRGVSKMFAGDDKEERHHQTGNKGPSPLRNTSSISRKLASGSDKPVVSISVEDTKSTNRQFDSAMYFSLCRAYGIVLARWGGGGRDDIIGNVTAEEALRYKDSEDKKGIATLTADPATISLLNILCFSTTVVRTSWAQTQSNRDIVRALHAVVDDSKG